MNITQEQKITRLFDYVRDYVLAESGDGWGLIVSNNYKELANLFEEDENKVSQWFTERINGFETIIFKHKNNEEEYIAFISYEYYSANPQEYWTFFEICVIVNNIIK